ncbi:MAG TPA: MoxR family ATPase, partial [Geodermatophilus sp.]|nr:MoxR family ATPase [Geodermatophilus sp.]
EREMHVPRFGRVTARPTFRLVAAMNPFDAVGTARVTPALYDRSCRVAMGYQDEDAELAVVAAATGGPEPLVSRAVRSVRITRDHPELRIGSSVCGAIDTVLIAVELATVRGHGADEDSTGLDAALAALTGKVTLADGAARPVEDVVADIWRRAGEELGKG